MSTEQLISPRGRSKKETSQAKIQPTKQPTRSFLYTRQNQG